MVKRYKRTSLKNVAELAGTSVATASRAISDSGYVADETRARVLEAAQRLNYQPNLRARSLRRRYSQSVGLIIPNLLNAYYTAFADTISQLLNEREFHLYLCATRDEPEAEYEMIQKLVGEAVDGLIWVPTNPSDEILQYLVTLNTPAVSIVRRVSGDILDTVIFEDFAGSQTATQHLIDLGHRRIGYIGGDICFSSNHDRWQGFNTAIEQAGLLPDHSLIKLGHLTSSWGFLATNDLLRQPEPPTAIYAASNALMPGVLRALRQQSIILPTDISLICFDDVDWFSFSMPPITAVKVGHNILAETAIEILFNRINSVIERQSPPTLVKIQFELVLRNSTAPPRRTPSLVDNRIKETSNEN